MIRLCVLSFLLFFKPALFAEETALEETKEVAFRATFEINNEYHHFVVQKPSGEVRCMKRGHNLFGAAKRYTSIDDCITEENSGYFRDADGSCVLVSTNTPYPLFLKEVPEKDCPPEAAFHPASNLENNLYQDLLQESQQTCELIGMCYKTLKPEDHRFMETLTEAMERIQIDESLKAHREEGQEGTTRETRYTLSKEIQKLKRLFVSCGSQRLAKGEDKLKAALALRAELEPMIKTLDHEIDVFHWFEATMITKGWDNKYEKESLTARQYARSLQNNYFSWDFDYGTGMQGRGLYASRTISSTRSYGDNVLKITIPEGSNYLDLEGNSPNKQEMYIGQETINALTKVGCDLPLNRSVGGGRYRINKFDFSADSSCREIFNSVIRNLEAKFMTYQYGQHESKVCEDHRDVAFVLIDVPMNEDTVDSFSLEPGHRYASHDFQMAKSPPELQDYLLMTGSSVFNELSASEKQALANKYSKRIYDCKQVQFE